MYIYIILIYISNSKQEWKVVICVDSRWHCGPVAVNVCQLFMLDYWIYADKIW